MYAQLPDWTLVAIPIQTVESSVITQHLGPSKEEARTGKQDQ